VSATRTIARLRAEVDRQRVRAILAEEQVKRLADYIGNAARGLPFPSRPWEPPCAS
jgi:hypothetical protein